MAKTIDQNSRQVGLGFVQGTDTPSTVFANNLILPFSINSSNELLIEVIPIAVPLDPFAAPARMKIDQNSRQIGGAITDDSNKTITPVTVDLILTLPCVRVEDPSWP